MEDGKNVGGILLAFLAGSVVGTVLGIMLAPSSGSETRRKIKETSLEAKDKAMEKALGAKDKAMEKVEYVKSEATEIVERGKEKATGIKSQIQAAVDAGKEAYSQKKSDLMPESEEE